MNLCSNRVLTNKSRSRFMSISTSGCLAHTPARQWTAMSEGEVSGLAQRLVAEDQNVSIKQYPSYNERYRRVFSKPIFLKYLDENGQWVAMVCVIRLMLFGIKCGAVIDGPAGLVNGRFSTEAARQLVAWFRSNGYAFVRFSHRTREMLDAFTGLPETVSENPLPFVPRWGGECVIELKSDDSAMLAGFQQIARQEIKYATKAGCAVKRSSEFEDFRKLWPVFTKRAKEKGFRHQSLETYETMFKLSPGDDLVRLYSGCYDGQTVYAMLFLKEHSEVFALMAALDRVTLAEHPSPCCLVLWTAMRDYRDLGCIRFNLGAPTGSLSVYKRKFRPTVTPPPCTLTVVLKPLLYRVWTRHILPLSNSGLRAARLLKGGR